MRIWGEGTSLWQHGTDGRCNMHVSRQAQSPSLTWLSNVQTPAPAPACQPQQCCQVWHARRGGKLPQDWGLAHTLPSLVTTRITSKGVLQPRHRPGCAPLATHGPEQAAPAGRSPLAGGQAAGGSRPCAAASLAVSFAKVERCLGYRPSGRGWGCWQCHTLLQAPKAYNTL